MRSLPLLFLAGCATATLEEKVSVPGTSLLLEMVYVPGGAKARPFWISRREVTWGEFDRFYQYPEEQRLDGITRPSSGKNYLQLSGLPAEQMEEGRPVTNLRYHSAISYCEWLSARTGMIFRLPTETEWEAAPGEAKVAQYCLEPERPPDFGPVLRGTPRRSIPPEWDQADPNRPVSTWWFRTGHTQGFRVVRVPEGAPAAERKDYASKIEVSGLAGEERTVKVGASVSLFSRVTGEVTNGGDRALDELALKVYYLDPRGKPHFEDVTTNLTRRATFNLCLPAVRNTAHPGLQGKPLQPGERRRFTVDLPITFDAETDVKPESYGASVLHLRFAGD
ncbi:MAG: SUMF1/EgtB/PvdO family nonheme iron enzyme [Planctomycetes bacterium]|nr:SUMF1/EgtB/PvdO family nonheme iron enzyme [Planctomycetota bacterium]